MPQDTYFRVGVAAYACTVCPQPSTPPLPPVPRAQTCGSPQAGNGAAAGRGGGATRVWLGGWLQPPAPPGWCAAVCEVLLPPPSAPAVCRLCYDISDLDTRMKPCHRHLGAPPAPAPRAVRCRLRTPQLLTALSAATAQLLSPVLPVRLSCAADYMLPAACCQHRALLAACCTLPPYLAHLVCRAGGGELQGDAVRKLLWHLREGVRESG
jgi:hypothetical protein